MDHRSGDGGTHPAIVNFSPQLLAGQSRSVTVTLTPANSANAPKFFCANIGLHDSTLAECCQLQHCFDINCRDFPAGQLPGDCPCNGQWSLRTIKSPTPINNLSQAMLLASDPALLASSGGYTVTTGWSDVLNHRDRDVPGSPKLFSGKKDIPGTADSVATRYVVTVAKATITISAANAGVWTFGLRADDGIAFRLLNTGGTPMPWASVSGPGNTLQLPGNTAVQHDLPTPDTNCHAVINLPAGDYCAEFVHYNQRGPADFEVYAARGSFTAASQTHGWKLVGYKAPQPGSNCWPCLASPAWNVHTTNRGTTAIHNLATAATQFFTPWTYAPALNFQDPESPSSSSIGGDLPFPGNLSGPLPWADDNHFALEANALVTIPCEGDYCFGFQGDDGTRLIFDLPYTTATPWAAAPGFRATMLKENRTGLGQLINNATFGASNLVGMQADTTSGNNRTVASLHLPAGTWPLWVLHREGTGGSSLEVFCTPAGQPYATPRLLTRNTCEGPPDHDGLPLCDNRAIIRYQDWVIGFGLNGNSGLRTADADADGWSNGLEYALGSNPVNPASTGLLTPGSATLDPAGTGPAQYFTLSFERPLDRTGVNLVAEFTSDFVSYEPGIHVSTVPVDANTVRETWRWRDPASAPGGHRAFARLREDE